MSSLREEKDNPYKNGIHPEHLAAPLHEQYDAKTKEELEANEVRVSVAGRIMMVRDFGKAGFVKIKDRSGGIQLFVQKKSLGDDAFKKYKDLDVGDIVYSEGALFKTKTNELSVKSEKLTLLTKSLRPLPEKFHGLTDIETKYRQRYVDLIMNDSSRKTFLTRSKIINEMRKFFEEKDFVEVETPMMHPLVGGAAARPFKTHHNTLDMDLFLRIAPELYLKRLVVGGLDRVFEINRNFRNEGISIQHNPEFTMVEFYHAYATYNELMDITEELFIRLAEKTLGSSKFKYQDKELDFSSPWKRITVEDAVMEFAGYPDRAKLRDRDALIAFMDKNEIPHNPKESAKAPAGKLLMTIFEEKAEKHFVQPTFVTQFPMDVSPLSRTNESDPFLTDRFELYIYGREIANGFSELNDPVDQKERFQAQVDAKAAGDEEACDMDEDYITALEYGLPPTAGEGIGIDRLVMLFTDAPSIRDVILFPQMRPQKAAAEDNVEKS